MPNDSRQTVPGGVPAWLPWVAAPVFFALPLGGCGLAVSGRQVIVAAPPAPVRPSAEPRLVPVTTVATVVTTLPR